MASKADFSAEEWKLLSSVPHAVGMVMAQVGGSGLMGTMKEAFSAAQALVEHGSSSNDLVKALCNVDEVKAAEAEIRHMVMANPANAVQTLKTMAVDNASQAVALLKAKAPGDVDAYKGLVSSVADKVANAAKEGGFLGFGGTRFSEAEKTFMDTVTDALK
jgi:hypothetical protein